MTIYIAPTDEAARDFMMRQIKGPVVMLNLLRFRDIADYSDSPSLAPNSPISGVAAYQIYMEHTAPFLKKSGGELLFYGDGGSFLIGPETEKWDQVLLVKQSSVEGFFAFAQDTGYLAGIGHRTAALLDSRILPMIDKQN